MRDIATLIDLDTYPLDRADSPEWQALVASSKAALAADGMFNLENFLRPGVAAEAAAEIAPVMAAVSHTHKRVHNIYFKPEISRTRPGSPGAAEGGDRQPHPVRRPDRSEHRARDLRLCAARPLPRRDDGQAGAPPDGRSAGARQRHVVPAPAKRSIGISTGPSSPRRCFSRRPRPAASSSTAPICVATTIRTSTASPAFCAAKIPRRAS